MKRAGWRILLVLMFGAFACARPEGEPSPDATGVLQSPTAQANAPLPPHLTATAAPPGGLLQPPATSPAGNLAVIESSTAASNTGQTPDASGQSTAVATVRPEPAELPRRKVRFSVRAPADTPPGVPVRLLLLHFTDWEWAEHLTMAHAGGGNWTAEAELEDGALVHYAYDIWDESAWDKFKEQREVTATGVPVDRRLVYVSRELDAVSDVIGAWGGGSGRLPTGMIRGIVLDAAGAPVIDSEVTVAGIHTSTDWDGRFRVEVAAGRQRVMVYRADGAHLPAVIEVDVMEGNEIPARLVVTAAQEVPVTFKLMLPPGTPEQLEIRVAGSVRQLGSSNGTVNTPYVMASSTGLPALARTGPDSAEGTFMLREGSYVQYFYTLTSDGLGREWGGPPWRQRFRSFVVTGPEEVREERVISWRNGDWPAITFRVHVPSGTPEGVPIIFEMGPSHVLSQTGPRTWSLTISSVPNAEFRYRYLLGGDGQGSDGSPDLQDGGYRTAKLGSADLIVNDIVSRWQNIPELTPLASGAFSSITFNVSVPAESGPPAETSLVFEDRVERVTLAPVPGNPWLLRGLASLPAGTATTYHLEATGKGNGPARTIRPQYATETVNDWVAAWSAGSSPSGPARPGYAGGYYTPDFWSPHFAALADSTFERIAEHGGNLVAVSSVWSYGRIRPLPVVEPRAVEAPSVLTPRNEIDAQVVAAHENGLNVLLAPQFNMEMSPGGIEALSGNPSQWWDQWLVEAERFWMWNAQVADETGAEILMLPGFVFHVFAQPGWFESQAAFEDFDRRLAELVGKVRTVYAGKLLISGGVRESRAPGLADYVGVTTYDTGHPDLPAASSVEEWKIAYESLFTEKIDPIHERWGKPVFVYTIHLPPLPDDSVEGFQESQARRIEGLMQALESRPWVAGSMSWSYGMIDAPLAEGDGLRGRLAEAVLAKYYERFIGR